MFFSKSTEWLNKITITHILLISLVLHVLVISHPPDQVGDETIFLSITRNFLDGNDYSPYQLPGLSIIAGLSMTVFGDNWFGWRFPSLIFGIFTLFLIFNLSKKFTNEKNALFLTTIISFDYLFFTHSSLLLRDMPVIFFGMLALNLYFSKKYYLTALILGIAALIKETALFFLIFIIIYHTLITKFFIIQNVNFPKNHSKTSYFRKFKTSLLFSVILFSAFLFPLWIYDAIIQPDVYDQRYNYYIRTQNTELEPISNVTNPISHLMEFLFNGYLYDSSQKNQFLKNTILPIGDSEIPITDGTERSTLRLYGKVSEITNILKTEWTISYSNYPLWIFGFWSTIAFIAYNIISKQNIKQSLFLALGIISMFVPYIIISFSRVTFAYYFIYTIPFVMFGSILLLDSIKNPMIRIIAKTTLFCFSILSFVFLFPLKFIE